MTRALDGLLVVAVEQAVAAPYCTGRLAEGGARVIKIERPEGDFARAYDHVVHGESANFVWLNQGKESLVLDFKNPDDLALLLRIIAKADVVVQNLAPGAAARAGFGSAELRARHPRLITCDISGYGERGAYRDMKAYDLLIQAEAGLCSLTGGPDAPARVGVSVCDIAAGMNAQAAILEALIERGRTGWGKGIEVSLFDGMAEWMTVPLLHFDYGGQAPKRVGLRHPTIAPYGIFATADGAVVVSIQNEREWARLCADILGHPQWAVEGPYASGVSRVAHRAALEQDIGAIFARFATADLTARLTASQIAFGQVNDVAGLSRHPALRRVEAATPTGPAAVPARIGVERSPGPVPAIGQHSAALRQEFG